MAGVMGIRKFAREQQPGKITERVFPPSPTLTQLNDLSMSGFDPVMDLPRVIEMAREVEQPRVVPVAAVPSASPVAAVARQPREVVVPVRAEKSLEDIAREKWEDYNRSGLAADFVRADEALMRARQPAKDGGMIDHAMRIARQVGGPLQGNEGILEGFQPRSFEEAQRILNEQNNNRLAREELARSQTPQWQEAQAQKAFEQSFTPTRLSSMNQQQMTPQAFGIPNFTTPQQQNLQMNDAIAMAREIEARNRRQEAGQALAQTWPVQMAKDIYGAVTAPGDVLYGRLNPQSDEAIKRAFDLAGITTSSTLAQRAPAGAVLGSGPVRQTVETQAPARELTPLGFYSHGYETAAALPQTKGTPEQIMAMLERQGVKPVEMEGFREAFAGRPSITREEAAEYFRGRLPQIEETVLGGPSKAVFTPEMEKRLDELTEKRIFSGLSETEMAEKNKLFSLQEEARRGTTPTRYNEYTLPGGENYREVLLRTPHERKQRVGVTSTGQIFTEEELANPIVRRTAEKIGLTMEDRMMPIMQPYKSGHWEEPNVLAHMRMSDRVGPQGEKVLHLEELQSDWAQEGRKKGFKGQNPVTDAERAEFNRLNVMPDRMRTPEENARLDDFYKRLYANQSGTPTAPYVTKTEDWTNLALKRALREAAEGGYDRLVWTPGVEQAKRYDLSKQLDQLSYDPSTKKLIGEKDGQIVFGKDDVPQDKLADYVGKDVAAKLMQQERSAFGFYNLSGEGLSVGGEGMKGYYDKIVPTALQKLTKKLDPSVKIGMSEVSGIPVPSIEITPKMREEILKGLPAYADGGAVADNAIDTAKRIVKKSANIKEPA